MEKIRGVKQKLIDFVCSPKEKSYIKSDQDFYEIWTNKEAISKAEGNGLSTDLKEINALPINGIKTYKGKQYLTKTIIKDGYVIGAFDGDICERDFSDLLGTYLSMDLPLTEVTNLEMAKMRNQEQANETIEKNPCKNGIFSSLIPFLSRILIAFLLLCRLILILRFALFFLLETILLISNMFFHLLLSFQ